MGTDIRSIIRVGVTGRVMASGGTPILDANCIERNQPDYTGDNVKPNQTGVAVYTVEFIPSAAGDMSVIINDGTADRIGKAVTAGVGELKKFSFSIRAGWTFNIQYSVAVTLQTLVILEHGGVV